MRLSPVVSLLQPGGGHEPGRSEAGGVTAAGGRERRCPLSGLCSRGSGSERRTLGRLPGWAVWVCGVPRRCRMAASEGDLGGGRRAEAATAVGSEVHSKSERLNMVMAFEQQPRESAKAFAAFSLYLSMGPERSLTAVGAKLGKSKVMMEKWSRRFDWPARVVAHGGHLALVEREAAEAVVRAKGWTGRSDMPNSENRSGRR